MRPWNFKILALFLMLMLSAGQAAAIGDDEIRAQVMSVDEDAKTVTVQPFEVGKDINIPNDEPATFEVDQNTRIRDEVRSLPLNDLGDIEENDIVRIDFEERDGNRRIARNISRDQSPGVTQQGQAQGQRQQLPAELPDTASIWPALALSGFGVWTLAFLLRLGRRRG